MTTSAAWQRGSDLLRRGAAGEVAATSQLITSVESRSEVGLAALEEVYSRAGRAHVVGVTGAPGSGKSTLVAAMAREWRSQGWRVAVVAVDPSSSLTGGAILGDRIRMTEHTLDPGIFVRSMSSRGVLGGLSRATVDVVAVLDATGWDVVVVETVGVGQAEIEIVQIAESTVVVSVPGLGDGIQAIKAGILEIADVHVVNKVDRPDADKTIKELVSMLTLGIRDDAADEQWSPPVLGTVATSGVGVPELVTALARHRAWLSTSGQGSRRRRETAQARVRMIAKDLVIEQLYSPALSDDFDATIDEVIERRISPYAAAERLVERISHSAREGKGNRHD